MPEGPVIADLAQEQLDYAPFAALFQDFAHFFLVKSQTLILFLAGRVYNGRGMRLKRRPKI